MDDDYAVIPYLELLLQSVSRCVIDWRCFCERKVTNDFSNSDQMRGAMIQFCRLQREIFLKLYVLHNFSLEQKKIDKMIQNTLLYENFLGKAALDISQNIQKLQVSDLIMACPNVSVAVDLLSTGNYTRMPQMLPVLAESSVSNSVPLPLLGLEEYDLTMARINNEYRWLFQLSECKKLGARMSCINGQSVLISDDLFKIRLIYDFHSWQVLDAIPLLVETAGYGSDGETRNSFYSIINLSVLRFNIEGGKNIYDEIYHSANLFCGKLIMEHLRTQASEYKAAKLSVTDLRLYVSTDPNVSILSCSDIFFNEGDYLVLEVSCFSNFDDGNLKGIRLRFQMESNGDVLASVAELPQLLNKMRVKQFKLEHWLEILASSLEQYQLQRIGNLGNIHMNFATGALHLIGLPIPFSLKESEFLLKILDVKSLLSQLFSELPPVSHSNTGILRELGSKIPCPHCKDETTIKEQKLSIDEKLMDYICDSFIILEEKGMESIHCLACYRLDKQSDVDIFLTIITHGKQRANTILLLMRSEIPIGIIYLLGNHIERVESNKFINFIASMLAIDGLPFFTTKPVDLNDTKIVALIESAEIVINVNGDYESISFIGSNDTKVFKSDDNAPHGIVQMLKTHSIMPK